MDVPLFFLRGRCPRTPGPRFARLWLVLTICRTIVGNFLRDQKSNYLEGFLLLIVYVGIAVAAFQYPNPAVEHHGPTEGAGAAGAEAGGH